MIRLDYKNNIPIYEQIIEQIKFNTLKGYLHPGDAIPSVRKLALELSVTPGTVAKAYQELERQEIIETIRGKGAFIAQRKKGEWDQKKLHSIQPILQSQLVELKLMGMHKQEIVQYVTEIYDTLESEDIK